MVLLTLQMSRVLRNFNITKISDLELISNSTDRLEITFHFFGVKSDSLRIREAITRMVERGRIRNITLVSNFHIFYENPPLKLMDTIVNKKSPIREDSEFIISCVAQGSARLEFQWYKDGAVVNVSRAIREIWTTVLPPESKDVYTAILGITKANKMDEGVYTCKVVDWGVEQCRSIHVHIQTPPRLRVDPASVTLHRGDSLRVRCLSPGNDIKRYGQLGYSWTRNGILFQSDPQTVMWEDLYPDGSILKINNIQKSAEYSCVVSNSVSPVSKSVYVTVIDRNIVELCNGEKSYGVRWPTSAPGAAIISDCPKGYQGYSRRVCEKRDVGNLTWLQPDFSHCVADTLLETYKKFQALTSGYQKTNFSAILKSCLEYAIKRHQKFLPGEAGFLMDLLQEVESYLEVKGTQLEREMAAEIVLHILDKVMQNAVSLNSQQQIKKLQLLTQSAALSRETIAASQLATSTSSSSSLSSSGFGTAGGMRTVLSSSASSSQIASSTSTLPSSVSASSSSSNNSGVGGFSSTIGTNSRLTLSSSSFGVEKTSSAFVGGIGASVTLDEETFSLDQLNSLRIYMTAVKTLPFNLRIYGDDLFSDQLYMDIALSKRLLHIMGNSTIFASVISYKDLKSFLPKTYYSRGSDSKDNDYILASRVVQTWLFQSNRSNDNLREPLDLPFDAGHVEIIFQHESRNVNNDWIPVCGHDYKATFESTWRTDLCITKNLMENITRCICPLSGTFVVLLAKKNYNATIIRPFARPIFVIIGCGCCFLQSFTAFAVLLKIWYNRKCCITFLKMQFCISTSSIMIIFLLGFLKMLPQDWQPIISSTLSSLMLLGLSTIIAIALVVHSELVPRKLQVTNLSSGIRGAIGISWLLPILFAICSPLITNIIGKWPNQWWLEVGSSGFILFVVVEVLFIVLFGLLLYTLIRKLVWLLRKHDKHESSLWRRIGLLYRTGIILFLKLMTDSLFVAYLNIASNFFLGYIFGTSCILLGFTVLFCFVIKAEYALRFTDDQRKASVKTSLDDNYCSASINSPLSFYTNHEKEKDTESGAPLQQSPADASATHLPLTIISTAPRCQIVAGLQAAKSVETFLGVVVVGPDDGSSPSAGIYSEKKTKLQEMEQYHTLKNIAEQGRTSRITGGANGSNNSSCSSGSNSKSLCCNILLDAVSGSGSGGGSSSKSDDDDNDTSLWKRRPRGISGFYDAYTPTSVARTGSGHQLHHLHHHGMSTTVAGQITKHILPESHEFVGVETLDILQGVSPDSIIGIRTSTILTKKTPLTTNTTIRSNANSNNQQQHHKTFVECLTQKRVTIVETPKITQTFDSLSADASVGPAHSTSAVSAGNSALTPIITITTSYIDKFDNNDTVSGDEIDRKPSNLQNAASQMKGNSRIDQHNTPDRMAEKVPSEEGDDSINGMLDRISHDLDYLLNRTNEIPPRLISGGPPTSTTSALEDNALRASTSLQSPSNLTAASIECDMFPYSHCPKVVVSNEHSSIPPPPSGAIPKAASTLSLRIRTSAHHEVIIEEDAEQEQE